MDKDQNYLRRVGRRMRLGGALAILGLGLVLYGCAMQLAHSDGGEDVQFAWQMFSAIGVVSIAEGLAQWYKNRKILRGPEFYQKKGRVEDEDERSRLAEQLAWQAAGRGCAVLLCAAMIIALAAEQLAVFWTCYVTCIVLMGGQLLLKLWYGRRL